MTLNRKELAECLGVSERIITYWCKHGVIPRRDDRLFDFDNVERCLQYHRSFKWCRYEDPTDVLRAARQRAEALVLARATKEAGR